MYVFCIKRLFDFIISLLVLAITSPLIIVIIAILSSSKKKYGIIFTQDRPGKETKVFKIIKFKTMNEMRDENGNLLHDKYRLTKIGKFLRSTSLDELPQLINVLKGDMSLVGPRPLLEKYLPLYNQRQACRHNVRPGITGWTQINGRNNLSWQEKFELDVWYIENISFHLDMKILWVTLIRVIQRKDINSSVSITMEPFTGNKTDTKR